LALIIAFTLGGIIPKLRQHVTKEIGSVEKRSLVTFRDGGRTEIEKRGTASAV
jgi:hypothetical protein